MTNPEHPRVDPWHPEDDIDASPTAERADHPEAQPAPVAPQALENEPGTPSAAQAAIDHYGTPFRAFLSLPDIRSDDPELVDIFRDTYVGQFVSMDEIVDSLTEITTWEAEISSLAERLGISGYITLDRAGIADRVRDTWDIVPLDGALYVFMQ